EGGLNLSQLAGLAAATPPLHVLVAGESALAVAGVGPRPPTSSRHLTRRGHGATSHRPSCADGATDRASQICSPVAPSRRAAVTSPHSSSTNASRDAARSAWGRAA